MLRRMRWTLGLFLLAAGLGTTGCSTGGSSGNPGPAVTPETAGEGVQLEVKNEQRMEADIWVFVDGHSRRLGRVESFSEGNFLIPMDRARRLRLEFRLFGGPTCVTREVSMLPGESATYTIPLEIRFFDAVCRGES